MLFKALEIVKEKYPDIILEVIGGEDEPGMMSELLQLTKKLKLEENVQFAGSRKKTMYSRPFQQLIAVLFLLILKLLDML